MPELNSTSFGRAKRNARCEYEADERSLLVVGIHSMPASSVVDLSRYTGDEEKRYKASMHRNWNLSKQRLLMGSSIYFYDPSLAACIIFTILYLLPFIYHFHLSVIAPWKRKSSRAGYFVPVMIGAAIEVVAYAIRAASVKKPDNIGLYAISATLIVIAPVLVCASLYILIGRLIQSTEKEPALLFGKVSPAWIPRVFVTSDILSFLTQASGSGIASSNDWEGTQKDVGVGVLIGGLVLQLATFALFLVIVIWFDMKSKPSSHGGSMEHGVRLVLNGIYVSGLFIMVRLIYRVIEFSMGMNTYTWTHEWPLYVLEAAPMFIAMVALGWYHPARWIPSAFRAKREKISSERNSEPISLH
ncbi:Protein RTA1 [Penicillium rolfsii]|nr:Protein RTA1 [Penicillium rolfsii]